MTIGERYEQWMELETSYSLQKFKPSEQYPYWAAGITRGSFSYKSSALTYMVRALSIARLHPQINFAGGLSLALNLGKAAHNLVAMEATARSYSEDGGRGILIASELDAFSRLAEGVQANVPYDEGHIMATQVERRDLFAQLQSFQDAGDLPTFHAHLYPELQFAANQFVSAAEHYGWPEPGDTRRGVKPWNPVVMENVG
jgi:hypothetical protein